MKIMIKEFRTKGIALLAAALLAGSAFITSCDDDEETNDMFTISGTANGANEVPPVTTSASGSVSGTYNRSTNLLTYNVAWTDLSGVATAAHFHGPALVGETAPPVIAITLTTPGISGNVSGSATLTDAQESDLLEGKWYFNVHTAANPDGEIRTQVSTSRP
jgi:CHRD domain